MGTQANFFSIFLMAIMLVVAPPGNAGKKETSGKTRYTFTGNYNPIHRRSQKITPAAIKQAEAFWAAYCNIAVNLARLEDEKIAGDEFSTPGWSVASRVAAVEVMAMYDTREGEQAVCRLGNLLAIFTREGELSSFVTSNRKKIDELRNQKWPAAIGGIKITGVRYSSNCESDDCECEITVEYP